MTQSQLITYLADKIGITKTQAKAALDQINTLVTRELKREGSLRLAGLGVFRKRRTKARHRPQPGDRRADQDSGADAAALHAGQGVEGFGVGNALTVNPALPMEPRCPRC